MANSQTLFLIFDAQYYVYVSYAAQLQFILLDFRSFMNFFSFPYELIGLV